MRSLVLIHLCACVEQFVCRGRLTHCRGTCRYLSSNSAWGPRPSPNQIDPFLNFCTLLGKAVYAIIPSYLFPTRDRPTALGRQILPPAPGNSPQRYSHGIFAATSAFHCSAEAGPGYTNLPPSSCSSLPARVRDECHSSTAHSSVTARQDHQEGQGWYDSHATHNLDIPATHPPWGIGAATLPDFLCASGRRLNASRSMRDHHTSRCFYMMFQNAD